RIIFILLRVLSSRASLFPYTTLFRSQLKYKSTRPTFLLSRANILVRLAQLLRVNNQLLVPYRKASLLRVHFLRVTLKILTIMGITHRKQYLIKQHLLPSAYNSFRLKYQYIRLTLKSTIS